MICSFQVLLFKHDYSDTQKELGSDLKGCSLYTL